MSNAMDLSIVIRCCNDPRVFQCIKSIDEDVEIIVSMCENKGILKGIEDIEVKHCIGPPGNLSITSNKGFKIAKYNKVIITDSDTCFEKGSIKKVYYALDKHLAVRCKVEFLQTQGNFFSKLVAEARDFVYSKPVIFTPGIGIRKEILPLIGGYLFNESIPFAVDAELNYRIQNENISNKILESAVLYHRSEKLVHDLKAAYRIGKGCRIGTNLLMKKLEFIKKDINLKVVNKSMYKDIIDKKGILILVYQLFWDMFYHIGWRIEKE